MCTVTYLPKGQDHFLFASNRDESPKRAAQEVVRSTTSKGKTVLYPRDTGASGTWIAVSDANQLVCILNGGLVKHRHTPPYRLSRGIMALAFFDFQDVRDFAANFDFTGIEPFTMVIYDQGRLYTFYWNEREQDIRELDPSARHLWASCTLYPPELQQRRREWFTDWTETTPNPTRKDLTTFHHTGGTGDPENDLVMNRGGIVRTTSITSLEKKPDAFELHLLQLAGDRAEEHKLKIR